MRDREREIIGAKQGTASYSDKRERECVNDFYFLCFSLLPAKLGLKFSAIPLKELNINKYKKILGA